MSAKRPRGQPSSLPTKEQILEFIRGSGGKASRRDIARAFGIKDADRVEMKRILRGLVDERATDKSKGRLGERGRISGAQVLDIAEIDTDGELWARPAKWSGDGDAPLFRLVPGRTESGPALGIGERVLAKITSESAGALEAQVIKRLCASAHEILGVVKQSPAGPRVMPVDRRTKYELSVSMKDLLGARVGDLVLCEMLPDQGHGLRRARIKERLGQMSEPKSISLIAIHAHRLPTQFPQDALDEADEAKPAQLGAREDLRALPFITIDPDDARDHDDAVFAEPDSDVANAGGIILWVAIADVAYYVRPDSALDRAAYKRGNSVYFPDRVVPMLPERLSADLCSLREGEVRPVLAVRMQFDASGHKRGQRFTRALMRSAARLTYREAQNAWNGQADAKTKPLMSGILSPLFSAYETLKRARQLRSPLDLDLPEHRIRFDAVGKIAEVVPRERLESMRLIEEFMIAANVAAAEILEQRRVPVLYRVHEPPEHERLKSFSDFVKSLGLKFPVNQAVRPRNFNQLLSAARGTDYEPMLHEVILRTQSQARYALERLGHFGLALSSYAHFTSPIRRYSDLVVHRAIIRALNLGDDGLGDSEIGALGDIGAEISYLERRAMAAERDATDRYLAAYLFDRIGARFQGRIAGVTHFGLFVRLSETGADGIIPIRSLGNDYFLHDETRHALIGEATGATFRLGELVEVRLLEAAPITGGLVFELLSEPKTYSEKKARKRGALKARTKSAPRAKKRRK